jgi:hypothetical protein
MRCRLQHDQQLSYQPSFPSLYDQLPNVHGSQTCSKYIGRGDDLGLVPALAGEKDGIMTDSIGDWQAYGYKAFSCHKES